MFEEAQHMFGLLLRRKRITRDGRRKNEQELKTKFTKEPKNRHILKLSNTCHYISARNGFQILFKYILRAAFKTFEKNGQIVLFVGDSFQIYAHDALTSIESCTSEYPVHHGETRRR